MVVAELADDGRQSQLLDARHLRRNRAKGGADAGFLAVHVDAKAAAVGGDVREVEVMPLAQVLQLRLGQDLRDVALELRVAQVAKLDRQQIAVHAQHRRHADGQMQVRAALRRAQLEERVDSCHNAEGYS